MLSRREMAGMAGALAVHAAAFACLSASRAPRATVSRETPAELEVQVDEVAPPPASPRPAAIAARDEAAAGQTRAPERVSIAAATTVLAAASAAPAASAEAAPPGEPHPFTVWQTPGLSADALGLGGRNVFLGHVPGAPPASSAPDGAGHPDNLAPGVQDSVRDALHARDHALGLDVGGPLVGVAEAVVRPSDTPVDSRAVFEVTVDASGRITGVRLLDASQARGAWERVAASFATALRSQHLALRGHAGAVITLAVDSRWVMPSGSRPRHPIGPPTADGCRVRADGCRASMAFDVTDLATKPSRQVHARVLAERFP